MRSTPRVKKVMMKFYGLMLIAVLTLVSSQALADAADSDQLKRINKEWLTSGKLSKLKNQGDPKTAQAASVFLDSLIAFNNNTACNFKDPILSVPCHNQLRMLLGLEKTLKNNLAPDTSALRGAGAVSAGAENAASKPGALGGAGAVSAGTESAASKPSALTKMKSAATAAKAKVLSLFGRKQQN